MGFGGSVGGDELVVIEDIVDEGGLFGVGQAAGPFDEGDVADGEEVFSGVKIPGFCGGVQSVDAEVVAFGGGGVLFRRDVEIRVRKISEIVCPP